MFVKELNASSAMQNTVTISIGGSNDLMGFGEKARRANGEPGFAKE